VDINIRKNNLRKVLYELIEDYPNDIEISKNKNEIRIEGVYDSKLYSSYWLGEIIKWDTMDDYLKSMKVLFKMKKILNDDK